MTLKKSMGPRLRRAARRKAGWILIVALLAAVAAWHVGVKRRPMEFHNSIALPALPPIAAKSITLHVVDQPMVVLLKELSRQAGTPFKIDWGSMQKIAVGPKTPVSLDTGAGPMTLDRVFRILKDRYDLEAVYCETPVLVSTREDIETGRHSVEVTYPVRDLLSIPDPLSYSTATTVDQRQALGTLITSVCQPEIWESNGGTACSYQLVDDQLIVQATPDVHYMIRQLLQELRREKQ